MYDGIKCDIAMPDDRVAPGSWFQTKSLGGAVGQFTITRQGRLISHQRRYDAIGVRELRPSVSIPQYEQVPLGDEDMNYHGDIRICAPGRDGSLVEYVVRFTHGVVEHIWPYEVLSDIHKSWFYAKD